VKLLLGQIAPTAVHFDDDAGFVTGEVGDVFPDGRLTPYMQTNFP
jgi:hypothetical protein